MKNKFIVVTLFFILISISKTNLAARLENVLLWNNSTVPFEIDPKFTFEETNKIIDALNEMMLQTNIVFIKHRPGQIENYIVYTKVDPRNEYIETHGGQGGISLTGYGRFTLLFLPVPQPINFWSVSIGTVKHETMHALGFNHEQCRSDRDNFITVNKDNIKPGWEINFLIFPGGRDIGDYDFNSIMHYSSNSGGKTETAITMERKNGGDNSFGNATDFSPIDIFAINSVYPFRPIIRTPIPGISFMAVGERRTVRVEANKEYNFFTIPVEAGQVYRIDAFNRDKWKSAIGDSSYTADGVRQGGCKRVPGNKYMRMLCDIYTIEENNASNFTGYRFAVNTDDNNITEFTVQANGEGFLMFYANDCPGTYLDNSGSIGVHVQRLAPPAEVALLVTHPLKGIDLADNGLQGKFGLGQEECDGLNLVTAISNNRTLERVREQIPVPTAAEPFVSRLITWPDIKWGVINKGESTTTSFQAQLYNGNTLLQTVTINGLASGEYKNFTYTRPESIKLIARRNCNGTALFMDTRAPQHISELEIRQRMSWVDPAKFKIVIDINNSVNEIDESNNTVEY